MIKIKLPDSTSAKLTYNSRSSTFDLKQEEKVLASFDFCSLYDELLETIKKEKLTSSVSAAVRRRAEEQGLAREVGVLFHKYKLVQGF